MTDLNDAFEKVDTGLTTHLAEYDGTHISHNLPFGRTSANGISREWFNVVHEVYRRAIRYTWHGSLWNIGLVHKVESLCFIQGWEIYSGLLHLVLVEANANIFTSINQGW